MRLVDVLTVSPGACATGEVRRGQVLRVTDIGGQQVADFTSFNLHDPTEHCDCIYTTIAKESWKLGKGDVLYTKDMNPLWTIVEDTCGVHYGGGGFCSRPLLRAFEGVDRDGCRDGLERALARRGLSALYLSPASCLNIFMNFPYREDGTWKILPPASKAGDFVELRAEMDALYAVSACPGPAANAGEPTPLRFELLAP